MGGDNIMQTPSISSTPFRSDVFGDSLTAFDIWNEDFNDVSNNSKDLSNNSEDVSDDFTADFDTASAGQSSFENSAGTNESHKASEEPKNPDKKPEKRHNHSRRAPKEDNKKPLRRKHVKTDSNDVTDGADSADQPATPNDPPARPSRRRPVKAYSSDSTDSAELTHQSAKPNEPSTRPPARRRARKTNSSDLIVNTDSTEQSTKPSDSCNDVTVTPRRQSCRKAMDTKTPLTTPSRRMLVKERSIRDLFGQDKASGDEATEGKASDDAKKADSIFFVSKSVHRDPRRQPRGNHHVGDTATSTPLTPARGRLSPTRSLDRTPNRASARKLPEKSSSLVMKRERKDNTGQSLGASDHGTHEDKPRRRMRKGGKDQSLGSSQHGNEEKDAPRRRPPKARTGDLLGGSEHRGRTSRLHEASKDRRTMLVRCSSMTQSRSRPRRKNFKQGEEHRELSPHRGELDTIFGGEDAEKTESEPATEDMETVEENKDVTEPTTGEVEIVEEKKEATEPIAEEVETVEEIKKVIELKVETAEENKEVTEPKVVTAEENKEVSQ